MKIPVLVPAYIADQHDPLVEEIDQILAEVKKVNQAYEKRPLQNDYKTNTSKQNP